VINLLRFVTPANERRHFTQDNAGTALALASHRLFFETLKQEEGNAVAPTNTTHEELAPIAATPSVAPGRPVQVLATSMTIHELTIDRPAIIAYLLQIPADKQEIALVHALEVGIMELAARRERFRH
jgi:hypothetical protein